MKIEVNIPEKNKRALEQLRSLPKHMEQLHAGLGMATETLLVRHMRTKLQPKGNKLNAPSTGYWQRAAESVDVRSDSQRALVSIRHRGVALHYYGGTVVPVKKKALTIPIHPDAHGKMVGDFPEGTIFAYTKKGTGQRFLARKIGDKVQPLYVLRKSTKHLPDPSVIPTDQEFHEALGATATSFLARLDR